MNLNYWIVLTEGFCFYNFTIIDLLLKGIELPVSAILTILGDFELYFLRGILLCGRDGNVIYRKIKVIYVIATVTLLRSFSTVLFL